MDTTALAERLERFVATRGRMRGIDHEVITMSNDVPLLTDDLREAAARLRAVAGEPATPASGEVRLFDSQWVNIVNHDNCWRDYDIENAVAQAVRMTEAAIAKNVADGKLPQPRPTATPTPEQPARAKGESHE